MIRKSNIIFRISFSIVDTLNLLTSIRIQFCNPSEMSINENYTIH